MGRYAAIDVGTNSVLLLVAEERDGRFQPVLERAEITRLGRGVDRTGRLAEDAIEETVRCLEDFARTARGLGVAGFAVTATSAARDAENGADFRRAVKERAGLEVQIISGEREAELSFAAIHSDFGAGGRPLVALDIGGGSTEVIFGQGGRIDFRRSFEVGSVRMTERFVSAHPVPPSERDRIREHLRQTFAALPAPPEAARLIGVAGTVTTLFAVLFEVEPYDAARVHGGEIERSALTRLADTLCALPLEARRKLPGLQPKRADVIAAGALVLEAAMDRLGAPRCTVSDRGLRWGLLAATFGPGATR